MRNKKNNNKVNSNVIAIKFVFLCILMIQVKFYLLLDSS